MCQIASMKQQRDLGRTVLVDLFIKISPLSWNSDLCTCNSKAWWAWSLPHGMCATTANAHLTSCSSERGRWDVFSQPSSVFFTRKDQYLHKEFDLKQWFQATDFGTFLLPLCLVLFLKLYQPSCRDTNFKIMIKSKMQVKCSSWPD